MEAEEYRAMYDAEGSHWWYRGLRDMVYSVIANEFGGSADVRVLDAGCGTGFFLKSLAGKASISVGIDIEGIALDYCRQRGLRNIARASVSALPFKERYFDVVVSIDVLYHRKVEDDLAALREACRVLKDGGILVAHVPAFDRMRRSHDERVHTRHRYTRSEMAGLVEAAGFCVRKLSYRNSFLYPAAIAMSLLHRQGRRPERSDLQIAGGGFMNGALYALARAENELVKKVDLPAGTSLFCVAVKGARK